MGDAPPGCDEPKKPGLDRVKTRNSLDRFCQTRCKPFDDKPRNAGVVLFFNFFSEPMVEVIACF